MEIKTLDMFREKFEKYSSVMKKTGEKKAWDALYDGYPQRQKKNMGPFIENTTLYKAFQKGIPLYKEFGMEMDDVDI